MEDGIFPLYVLLDAHSSKKYYPNDLTAKIIPYESMEVVVRVREVLQKMLERVFLL